MSGAAETDRLLDGVLALDARGRERLLGRIVGYVGAGGSLDADTLRRYLVEVGKPTPPLPRLDPSARPSSQAGLASFVHLRSAPGATRTGS